MTEYVQSFDEDGKSDVMWIRIGPDEIVPHSEEQTFLPTIRLQAAILQGWQRASPLEIIRVPPF